MLIREINICHKSILNVEILGTWHRSKKESVRKEVSERNIYIFVRGCAHFSQKWI